MQKEGIAKILYSVYQTDTTSSDGDEIVILIAEKLASYFANKHPDFNQKQFLEVVKWGRIL